MHIFLTANYRDGLILCAFLVGWRGGGGGCRKIKKITLVKNTNYRDVFMIWSLPNASNYHDGFITCFKKFLQHPLSKNFPNYDLKLVNHNILIKVYYFQFYAFLSLFLHIFFKIDFTILQPCLLIFQQKSRGTRLSLNQTRLNR